MRSSGPGNAGDDGECIQRIAAGDAEAIAELYDRHAVGVYSLALRITGNAVDAEKVVVNVFTQVWSESWRIGRWHGEVAPWLLTLGRSAALDLMRTRTTAPGDGAAVALPAAAIPATEAEASVRRALDALSDRQRLAIEMAVFDGVGVEGVSRRLALSRSTVMQTIREALSGFRAALARGLR